MNPQSAADRVEGGAAGVDGDFAQALFDAKELVVLRHAVGAAHRTRLDLTGIQAHRDVRDRAVFRFARAVRDDGGVAGALRHFDRFERLRQRADLVHLDEDRVGDALLDAFLEDGGVGDEEVVAHELHALAQSVGQLLPAFPVAFGHAVFDRDDRVAVAPAGKHLNPLFGRKARARRLLHDVAAVLKEFRARAVETERDVLPRFVARGTDRFEDEFDGFLVRLALRREAAFVAHGGRHAAAVDDLLQRVERFRTVAERFAEGRGPDRDDHEFLEVEVVVGVRAPVDDVHHRDGHLHGAHAAEVAVEREARFGGRGARDRHRDGEHGVGTQAALVFRAVQLNHQAVDLGLVARFETDQRVGDFAFDVADGLQDALPEVAGLVAVAQFDRFAQFQLRSLLHRLQA